MSQKIHDGLKSVASLGSIVGLLVGSLFWIYSVNTKADLALSNNHRIEAKADLALEQNNYQDMKQIELAGKLDVTNTKLDATNDKLDTTNRNLEKLTDALSGN